MTDIAEPYPRTYEVDATVRQFSRGLAMILVGVAAYGTIGQLTGLIHRSLGLSRLLVLDVSFALLAADIWLRTTRRVTLYQDAIAVTSWRGTRMLRTDEISCRRMGRTGKYRDEFYYIMVPVDKEQRELKLPPRLHTDKFFFAWMKPIPLIS
jgi:hypothetical protein